jgi:hypothetical protein
MRRIRAMGAAVLAIAGACAALQYRTASPAEARVLEARAQTQTAATYASPRSLQLSDQASAVKPSNVELARSRAAGAMQSSRHVLPAMAPNGGTRIAELDNLLDLDDGESNVQEEELRKRLVKVLAVDPAIDAIEVRCADSFCRLQLQKAVNTGLPWHEVDQAIAPLVQGEMIFNADANGDRAIAHVYFSDPDSQLPVAGPPTAEE